MYVLFSKKYPFSKKLYVINLLLDIFRFIGQISLIVCLLINFLAVFEYAEFLSFQSFYCSLVIFPNYVQKYNENHYRAHNV